ncbi:MAG: antibiotic biosynthesis monooxygenase [Gemmatimonadota bacterium]|nr:MAG: antibiotic biosynthesis monooxygenase [Gemmatimonadota bacterium]
MNAQVYWTLALEVQGGSDEFTALMNDMVKATQTNEPGTLSYEWSTSADGKVCHIFERYADSAAVMTHLGTFGEKFAGRFLEILKPIRFDVFGSPSEEVKEALAGFGPNYMQYVGGFSR